MIDVFPFAGYPVAVFGLGQSGLATAQALDRSQAEVWAWDDNEVARAAAEAEGVSMNDLADVSVIDELTGNAVVNGVPVRVAAVGRAQATEPAHADEMVEEFVA